MLKEERHAYLLQQLNLYKKIISSVIYREMKVSEDTVRRDLQQLASEGKIIKVHGGAVGLGSENNYTENNNSREIENSIARKAVPLIQTGMFVLSSGGNTVIELINLLQRNSKLTVITGSIPLVTACLSQPGIEIILLGDKVSRNARVSVGAEAIAKIRQLKADLCLLDICAIHTQHGITDNDWELAQIKRAMLDSSRKIIGLATSSVINVIQPVPVTDIRKIDYLVTELDPINPLVKPYRETGMKVI